MNQQELDKGWKKFAMGNCNFLKCKNPLPERVLQFRGGDRIRTGVQTYSSKAFYMLISLLFVGNEQEMNKPIHRLAG